MSQMKMPPTAAIPEKAMETIRAFFCGDTYAPTLASWWALLAKAQHESGLTSQQVQGIAVEVRGQDCPDNLVRDLEAAGPDPLACPEDLAQPVPPGRLAHEAIVEVLRRDGATFTGGCRPFYSPAEWRKLGRESCGEACVLIVCYEGGSAVAPYFSHDYDADNSYVHHEKMRVALEAAGFWSEEHRSWYAAVYPEKE